jgi:signal transduction histidine kinase
LRTLIRRIYGMRVFGFVGHIVGRVKKSLRLQLIITFGFCLLAALVASAIVDMFTENMNRRAYVDYSSSMEQMDWKTRDVAELLQERHLTDKQQLQERINQLEEYDGLQMLLVDLDGKVIMKSAKASESQVDLYSVISKAMKLRIEQGSRPEREEFVAFYPVEVFGQKGYLIARGIPEASIQYYSQDNPLVVVVFLVVFLYLFYRFTKRKTRYIEEMADSLLVISQGRLEHRVDVRGEDELGSLARSINRMAEELQTNIERERNAEKLKNELITNVSHDLRTPLTSVLGYLRLLKDTAGEQTLQQQQYVRIAYEKAEHLKSLVEDLFEYTALSNRGIPLQKQTICMNELIDQLVEEFVPIAEQQQLAFHKQMPEQRLFVQVDPEKFVRVLENLFSNAIKYGSKPGEVDVRLEQKENGVQVTVANKAEDISPEELTRLFERFYRVERSRSRQTGGSGLGLAIVKSIVELHGGRIWAESENGVLSFHIWLPQ